MVCIYDCYVINIDLLAEITIVILLANKEINHKVNYIFQKKKKERENKFPRLVLISILSTIQIRTYLRGGRREKNIVLSKHYTHVRENTHQAHRYSGNKP